ncbi:MAG: NAD(P)H-hydrate dehydratase [Candidatus Methylacidiphilales bacterium]|nr:NAD(P)H-hydrate dehydratase [Candidatus Methylacidiphilales bacterium]
MKVLPAGLLREAEAAAIASGAATVEGLMEAAVEGCLRVFAARPDWPRRVLVLAGKGNNGNDALLLASNLRSAGREVVVVSAGPITERTRVNLEQVKREESSAWIWPDHPEVGGSWTVVDGLLGTGSSGEPRGAVAEMLNWSDGKEIHGVRVALDFPSGMDPDTGSVAGPCFRADWTLAIGAVKPGCLADAARGRVGRLLAITLPLAFPPSGKGEAFIGPGEACRWIRPLPADLYKHRKGEVAVWAGSPGMAGAALLASRAALRAGAGLVRLFTHPELVPLLAVATPEVMVRAVECRGALPETLVQSGTILAGPGVGRSKDAGLLLRRLAEETRAAVLLDADALHPLAGQPECLAQFSKRGCVLTPHAGELAVLLGERSTGRREAVKAWHARHPGTVLVAKGPNTLVIDHLGAISHNATGHPGMATAGMGDVLSGIITALMAGGYPPDIAARLGVCWHGRAAELAVEGGAEQTLVAGDVIESLPAAWSEMERLAAGSASGPARWSG